MSRLEIGNRIKQFYEDTTRTKLMKRCPVVLRICGIDFHTFTKDFHKPFDKILKEAMQETMEQLCCMIQGCVFGYTQSDEITLILIDYGPFSQEAWLKYEVQKMVSTAASMTTMYFNQIFTRKTNEFLRENLCCITNNVENFSLAWNSLEELQNQVKFYRESASNCAVFDARCFNVPKEEVTSLVQWLQIDAMKNSVRMVASAHFSKSEIKNKTNDEMKKMLEEIGIQWDKYPIDCQRGACCIREQRDGDARPHWYIDTEIPIFKGEARDYVNRFIFIGEE